MAHQTYRLSFLSLLGRLLSALVVNLLLTHSCRGHSQLIGPSRSILAGIGDDIILPCHLKPVMDINAGTIEWTRPDLGERFVHVRRPGLDLEHVQNPSFKGRTSLFPDELKQGNISLKLSKVQLSDQGTYLCGIPLMNKTSSVRLVVALHTSSIPVISLSGIDRNKGGVILNCDSHSWFPEPEVFWLDSEGNLLSAGPTETVRGPDDLYTVSSRVTVEKRHSNSFTCRVQQNKANLTRETLFFISEDFFDVQSSFFSITTGLSVSLAVCILVMLLLGFYVWRQKKIKNKRSHRDETDKKENNQECEVLMTEVRELIESKLHEALQEKTRELQEEKQRREEEVQRKNPEPKNKTDELDGLNAEANKLTEEKKRSEEERQKWEKKLKEEEKKRERVEEQVKKLQTKTGSKEETIRRERRDKEEAQSEVKTLNDQLEFKNKELDGLKAEVNKLTEEKKSIENERKKLEQKLQDERKKSERDQRELTEERKRNTELMKELCDLHQLHEEKKKKEEIVKKLKEHLENKKAEVKELEAAKAKQWFPSSSTKEQKKEAEKEVENLKKQLETEQTELATKTKQLEKQLSEEKTKGKS